MLLFDIILGVAVAFLLATAFHMVHGGEMTTTITGIDGQPHKRLVFLKHTGLWGFVASFLAGVAMFLMNHYAAKLDRNTIWLGWLMIVILVAGYVLLGLFWKLSGTEIREAIVFAVCAGLPFFTFRAVVGIVSAPWQVPWLENIFCALPILLIVGFVAFMAIDYIIYLRKIGDKRADTVLAVAIAMIVVLLGVTLLVSLTGCSKTTGSAEMSQSESEEMEKAIDDLTVPKLSAEDLEKLTLSKYKGISETLLDSSLSPNDKERTEKSGFSDALTFGFTSKDNEKMFKELEEEILRNPVYGVAVANFLKSKKLGDKKLGDLNPWMGEMVKKNAKGIFTWCEYKDKSGTIYVTEEYRTYAATLCTFLERLVSVGVEKRQTVENWRLNDTVKNNDRAGIKADYQYKKEAYILAYVRKDGKRLLEIGFNTHDKRPEIFEEEKPKTTTPESHQVEESKPETSKPESTPEYSYPESSIPESKPESKPESSTPESKPESKPESSTPKYDKDPSKAPKTNTEPNDVSGPGPDTNAGKGSTESTKDKPTNSNKYPSYEEYKKDMEEMSQINETQKTGKDNNTPSTKPQESSAKVDNNGDNGTGNGGVNTPTPQTSSAQTTDGHNVADDEPGTAWGGPPD